MDSLFGELDVLDYFMIFVVGVAACCVGLNKLLTSKIEQNMQSMAMNQSGHGSMSPQKQRQKISPQDMTKTELAQYNGDNDLPILLGCKGEIFDVSASEGFYGPKGAYANFAGREASRALALHSTSIEDAERWDLEGVSAENLRDLEGWYSKFVGKYPRIGVVKGYDFKEEVLKATDKEKKE